MPRATFSKEARRAVRVCARRSAAALLFVAGSTPLHADLSDLSLEELMQVEVTSASGKAERIEEVAAAVHVITREDLRRSGATSIPDALRSVPGIDVARIDATKWAVSARGFNGRFANKLLVLLDGRQLYTPYFSGVLWDEQHVPFDLVERIEVVRGPGATIWGANAVNGVINIITRDAAAVRGAEIEVVGGNRDTVSAYVRQAGSLGESVDYRAWVHALTADPTDTAYGADSDDVWRDRQVGVRVDWHASEHDDVTTQLQVHRGDSEEVLRMAALNPLRVQQFHGQIDSRGGYFTTEWLHRGDEGEELRVFAQIDRADRRTAFYEWELTNYEVGTRHRFAPFTGHDVVWGASYRFSDVPLKVVSTSTVVPGSDESAESIELFVQDEIELGEGLALIIGSKIEHTEMTGWEPQPNVRMAWESPIGTFWGSVSRAVRTPSQGESEFERLLVPVVLPPGHPANPFPLPLGVSVSGNRDLGAERLVAYELGWRGMLGDTANASVSLYRHTYEDLVKSRQLAPTCEPSGIPVPFSPACLFTSTHLLARTDVANAASAHSQGVEVDIDWRPSPRWQLAAALDWRDFDGSGFGGATSFGGEYGPGDPSFIGSVRVSWRPTDALELNMSVRHVSDTDKYDIDDYTTLDARLGWRITSALSLEILGANLQGRRHREYASELGDLDAGHVERSAYARITWTR